MHIVIVNAHWNNRGDEAAHRALWKELRKRYPESEITILFKDRKPITWFPEMPGVTYQSCQFKAQWWDIWLTILTRGLVGRDRELKRMVQILKTCDLIIYPPGGSVISDRFYWSKQLEYLTPFLCARLYRIPMFVAAPSMGPYDARPKRRLRRWLLRTPRVFCVREEMSRQYLNSIGVSDNVQVTMDLAFLDDLNQATQADQLAAYAELDEFLAAHDKVVGITISDFKWHVKLGRDPALSARIEGSFRQFIQWLTGRGYGVLLIPQLFGNQDDTSDLRRYIAPGVLVMDENKDTYFQQFVIGRLHAVVGMRYHSNIFAAKMGTPFIAIPYEEKMLGFLEFAGLSEYSIPLADICASRLEQKFCALEKDHEAIRARLDANREEWRSRARVTVLALEKCHDPGASFTRPKNR